MRTEGHKRPHIRLLRRRAGLTQRDLAALLGYRSHSQISRFENGSRLPAANELLQLQVIFGVVPSGVFPHLKDRAAQVVVARIGRLNRTDQRTQGGAASVRPSCKTVHLERILDAVRRQISPGLNAHEPWPNAKVKNRSELEER